MAKSWTFTVEGRGSFPLDMLRYDACHPTDGDSVSNMDVPPSDLRAALRRVGLRSYAGSPTGGRWASFGWYVDKDSVHQQ